jgi:hypothetical protein
MKKITIIIVLFLTTARLFAQDCSRFIFMKKGRSMEMTSFNASGKMMHKVVEVVESVTTLGGVTTASASAQNFDQNGKPRSKATVVYKCDNGTLLIDASSMMPQQGNFQFTTAALPYPSSVTVGQHFANTTMTMTMNMGNKTITSKVDLTDRTVVAKESLTTPAGTWDCYKITYSMTSTTEGVNMPPYTATVTEWYVPGYAIVQYQMGAMVTKLTAVSD